MGPGHRDRARQAGSGRLGVLGPAVEVCGAPRVVRTRRARPVVFIPAHGSCPCEERRGFRGKERMGATVGTGRRHGVQTRRER
jgi:hypothetical protein